MGAAAAAWTLVVFAARIAIVSSSSEANGQATLHHANRDGERMAAVLAELGSFAAPDIWRLPRVTTSSLRAALDQADQQAAREPGSAIVIYYSGHADGEGLLLGNERPRPHRRSGPVPGRTIAPVCREMGTLIGTGGAGAP